MNDNKIKPVSPAYKPQPEKHKEKYPKPVPVKPGTPAQQPGIEKPLKHPYKK